MNDLGEIRSKIDFLLRNLDCEKTYLEYQDLEDVSKNPDTLEEIVRFTCRYSVDTKSPGFMSKLYSGSDSISLIADILISYFNTNVHVYSVSPVFTLAEEQVLEKMLRLVGFDKGDGIFLPGGSYCNTIAMICGRYHSYPDTKQEGNGTRGIKCITSLRSHYSIDKSAIMTGIGTNNVIKLDYHNLTEKELEQVIIDNNVFFINSTFGTTCEGMMENLDRFTDIFKKHGVWHHVDACVGGLALFSDKYRHLTDGFKSVDSITLDFHKAMNISIQCSALIVNHPDVLRNVTSIKAEYLFHVDSDHDMANRSFQCGRKADGFKVWIYDKLDILESRATDFFDRVKDLKRLVSEDQRFIHVFEDSPTHICFRIEGFNNPKLHDLITGLRKQNIFLEYYSDYIRMVPINPLLDREKVTGILDAVWEASQKF